MLRIIYIWLLRWHPVRFRQRFADEMLADFDTTARPREQASLIIDGFVSLIRQWTSRPHILPAEASAAGSHMQRPLFQTINDYKLSASTILNASLISTAILSTTIFAIGHGGVKNPFHIGAYYSRPGLISLDRASLVERELDAQIRFPAQREDPWRAIAALYFDIVLALSGLDLDRDYRISPRELAAATNALRKLDLNRDGKLSPEECGLVLGPEARARLAPDVVQRVRLRFMRANPVNAALDMDVDGELSGTEIRDAGASLRSLDRNGDRILTPNEVIPDMVASQVSMILFRLDKNGDDKLSLGERLDAEADPIRKIVDTADRNRDGITTREELTDRLQLSQEVKSQLDRALRANP